jgi:hypothetical protein
MATDTIGVYVYQENSARRADKKQGKFHLIWYFLLEGYMGARNGPVFETQTAPALNVSSYGWLAPKFPGRNF